jgi:PPIC-type PPIASE domain
MIELRRPPLFQTAPPTRPYRVAPWLRALGWGLAAGVLVSLAPGAASTFAAAQAPAKSAAKAPAKTTPKNTAKTGTKSASKSTSPGAAPTVATVGSRRIDTVDIQRAAISMAQDPLRKQNATAWRRMLLDRVVDRELLALEAERRELDRDPVLAKRIADREYAILLRHLYQKVLIPGLTPTKAQLAEIRATALHRGVDLHYLLLRDDASGANRPMAHRIYEAARKGARFDSLVQIYSGHPPSRAAGGHFGWVLARDLDPASYAAVREAKPGDVVGVYSGPYGHEIYKIGAFSEPSDDSLLALVYTERRRSISRDYDRELLRKYHFQLDSTQVQRVIFATGSETPDSILASLGPDGTRPERGVRPALGILATCDGDTVTFDDMLRATPPVLGKTGRMRIRDVDALYNLCARAVLRGLTVRDARERGLDREQDVARELRLSRESIVTTSMVERSRGPLPGVEELRAYYEKNRAAYKRPRTALTRVAVVADRDSAEALLAVARSRGGLPDTLLVSSGFVERRGVSAPNLAPRSFASTSLTAALGDSLGVRAAGAAAGALLPVTRVPQGYAVAQVISVEEARPMTFEEATILARTNWVAEAENRWVEEQLPLLRTKTPVQIQPGRLESVKLASVPSYAGGSNP